MMTRKLAVIVLLALGCGLPASTNCRAYIVGSIDGQDGWSGGSVPIISTIDQGITTTAAHTGSQSWHISNSSIDGFNGFGVYGGMPHSPGLAVTAGQPSSGAGANTFQASFWIKPASTSTAGDGSWMQIDFGDANSDDRVNFFGIKNLGDGSGGLQLRVAESVNTPDQFLNTQTVAAGLARSAWHQIVLTGHFLNGNGNDYFTISLDGNLLLNQNNIDPSPNFNTPNFFTFEGYQNFNSLPYEQTGRLFFAPSAAGSAFGYSDTAPQGYYIDDLTYTAFNSGNPSLILASFNSDSFEIPEPSSLLLFAVGGVGLLRFRQRQRGLS